MKTALFDYALPRELIAQEPRPRGSSRLLVLDRGTGAVAHRLFFDLPEILRPGDLLVRNDVRVRPARLYGRDAQDRIVEIFLLKPTDPERTRWLALAKPGRRAKAGARIRFEPDFEASVLAVDDESRRTVEFDWPVTDAVLERLGHVPLPPYIRRPTDAADRAEDREGYQTVYAREALAVAAPTAGLHFTGETFEKLRERGVEIADLTLAVGSGTFKPVTADDVSEHRLETEDVAIPGDTVERVVRARAENRRVVAVGTTVTRALEAWALEDSSGSGEAHFATDLFLTPGFEFRVVDALLTNFHLPALDSADARFRFRRKGESHRRVRGGDPRTLPLLLLRRRDADRVIPRPTSTLVGWFAESADERLPEKRRSSMFRKFSAAACLLGLALLTPLPAQEAVEIKNWSAPLFWAPPKVAKPDDSASSAEPMAAEGAPVAMPFIATIPCRVVDTRNAPGPYGGPAIAGLATARTFNIPGGPCGIPVGAGAFSINVAAILPAADGFLTVFPTGFAQPLSSDLNFLGGEVIANALIVPAGSGGSISVFANVTTHLIIDINGYYQFGALDTYYVNQGQPNSISSSMIVDGTIQNADISASAAISDTKLATIATAGKVADSALSANVSKIGQTIEGAEITNATITPADVADRVRTVSLPLGSFLDISTPHAIDFTDPGIRGPHFGQHSCTAQFCDFRLVFDGDVNPDQDGDIATQLTVPADYLSGGEFLVLAGKNGHAGNPETIACAVGKNAEAVGAFGSVLIGTASPSFYTCVPPLPAVPFLAGNTARVYIHIDSNAAAAMDDEVHFYSIAFRYTATD